MRIKAIKIILVLVSLVIGLVLWWYLQSLLVYPITSEIKFWLSPWTILGWLLWPIISAVIYMLLVRLPFLSGAIGSNK